MKKSTDVKIKELIMANKMFKKGLGEFSQNQSLYEVLIELKKELNEHQAYNGSNNIRALELMNLIAGIYFFLEDYEAFNEISEMIVRVTPLDKEMDTIILIAHYNRLKVTISMKNDQKKLECAKCIADTYYERLNFDDKTAFENEVITNALLQIFGENSKEEDFNEEVIPYLMKLYNARSLIHNIDSSVIRMLYSHLSETLSHFGYFAEAKKIIIENSFLCLIENVGIMEGFWNNEKKEFEYDDSLNDSFRSMYMYRDTIENMFLILDFQKFSEHKILVYDELVTADDFDSVVNKTLELHNLDGSFELIHNPGFPQRIWKYQLPEPYSYSSSTLLLRRDLLSKLRSVFNNDLMIAMPTRKELFITQRNESLMVKFASIAALRKTADRVEGFTGSRDVFIFSENSDIIRESYELLGLRVGEFALTQTLESIAPKTTGLKLIVENSSMKAPCFCGSGKKFKACCGRYFKQNI